MKKNIANAISSIRQKTVDAGRAPNTLLPKAHTAPTAKPILNKAKNTGPKTPGANTVNIKIPQMPSKDFAKLPEAKVGTGSVKTDQKDAYSSSKEQMYGMKQKFQNASSGKTAYDSAHSGYGGYSSQSKKMKLSEFMNKRLNKNANLYSDKESQMKKLDKSEYEVAEALSILIERYKDLKKSYESKKLQKGCDMLKSFLGKVKERKAK